MFIKSVALVLILLTGGFCATQKSIKHKYHHHKKAKKLKEIESAAIYPSDTYSYGWPYSTITPTVTPIPKKEPIHKKEAF